MKSLRGLLIDTHCHLDAAEFDADRDELMETVGDGPPRADAPPEGGSEPGLRARGAKKVGDGGTGLIAALVVPSVERANFGTVASICREYPACVPAYGIHPLYVDRAYPEDLDALRETLQREQAVAVGEIGLDRHVEQRDDDLQTFYFVEQIKIAQAFDLPVLLHVRRAIDPILKHLRTHPVRGGIAHAFNGSRQQAEAFIKLGFKLGFGGTMTLPGARRIRELATTLPLDAIVLETDAPDIPPVWKPRGRTTPDDLILIAGTLARLRGLALTEIADATTRNACAVLPRLDERVMAVG